MTTRLKCKVNVVKVFDYQDQAIEYFNTVRDNVLADYDTLLRFLITDKVSISSFLGEFDIKQPSIVHTQIREILYDINGFLHAALAKSYPKLFAAAKGRWMVNSILAKILLARTMLDPSAHVSLLHNIAIIASKVLNSVVFQKDALGLYYALSTEAFDLRLGNYSCIEIPILEDTTPKERTKYIIKINAFVTELEDKINSQDLAIFDSLFKLGQFKAPVYLDNILNLIRLTILDGFNYSQDPYIRSVMETVNQKRYAKEAQLEDSKPQIALAEYLYFLYQNRNLSTFAHERFNIISTTVFAILRASTITVSHISDTTVRFAITYSNIPYSIFFNNTTGRKVS